MENKVQVGSKVIFPKRKSEGENLALFNLHAQSLKNHDYLIVEYNDAYLNRYAVRNIYAVRAENDNQKYGRFRIEDFDLYEEPKAQPKFKVGDKVNPPLSKSYGESFAEYHDQVEKNPSFGIIRTIKDADKYFVDIYNNKNNTIYYNGAFAESDLQPYVEPVVTELKVGNYVNVPTTKSVGPATLEECAYVLGKADYGKIINITGDKCLVNFYNISAFTGQANFAKKDLTLKESPRKIAIDTGSGVLAARGSGKTQTTFLDLETDKMNVWYKYLTENTTISEQTIVDYLDTIPATQKTKEYNNSSDAMKILALTS